jgi:hypothetical protein
MGVLQKGRARAGFWRAADRYLNVVFWALRALNQRSETGQREPAWLAVLEREGP